MGSWWSVPRYRLLDKCLLPRVSASLWFYIYGTDVWEFCPGFMAERRNSLNREPEACYNLLRSGYAWGIH